VASSAHLFSSQIYLYSSSVKSFSIPKIYLISSGSLSIHKQLILQAVKESRCFISRKLAAFSKSNNWSIVWCFSPSFPATLLINSASN
jgi:hypothetical protein